MSDSCNFQLKKDTRLSHSLGFFKREDLHQQQKKETDRSTKGFFFINSQPYLDKGSSEVYEFRMGSIKHLCS